MFLHPPVGKGLLPEANRCCLLPYVAAAEKSFQRMESETSFNSNLGLIWLVS